MQSQPMQSEKPSYTRVRSGRGRAVRGLAGLLILVLCLAALPTGQGLAAPENQDAVVVITSPTEGSVVSGQVTIAGTATYPNFVSYGLLYAPGASVTGSSDWKEETPIAWNVQTMVVNGTLGTWDTTTLPNGQYCLALVVYEAGNDSPARAYFIANVTVSNEEATPTPETTETPTPEGPEAAATDAMGEPPAAPTIQQPATATPRPTPTVAPVGAGADTGNGDDSGGSLLTSDILSIDSIKESAKLGVQLAVLLYAVGVLYVVAKAVIRYYLRQTRRKSGS